MFSRDLSFQAARAFSCPYSFCACLDIPCSDLSSVLQSSLPFADLFPYCSLLLLAGDPNANVPPKQAPGPVGLAVTEPL